MNYVVYMIYFRPNQKRYFGITRDMKSRFYNHKLAKTNNIVHKAIRKYGLENIEFFIMNDNIDREKAANLEREYIDIFKSYCLEDGYNVSKGGEYGFHLQGEDYLKWRKTISNSMKNENVRLKLSQQKLGIKNPMYGIKRSTETLLKQRNTRKLNRTKMIPVTMDDKFTFFSVSEAALYCKNNLNASGNIYNVCIGKLKTAYGHNWKFAKKEGI